MVVSVEKRSFFTISRLLHFLKLNDLIHRSLPPKLICLTTLIMKLISFRIKNFRSIADSGKVPFSPDGITVFVGQNESGKSSVLDALFFALSPSLTPTEDDLRIGAALPTVELKVETSFSELVDSLSDEDNCEETIMLVLEEYLTSRTNQLTVKVSWEQKTKDSKNIIERNVTMDAIELTEKLTAEKLAIVGSLDRPTLSGGDANVAIAPAPDTKPKEQFTKDDFAYSVWRSLPLGIRFNEEDGALPNHVDINDKGKPTGLGAKAAANFLRIAEVDLPSLIKSDLRTRQNTMNRANSKVSEDFKLFWSQTIGKSGRLTLKCEIANYPSTEPEKSGSPHLVFWICDGNTQLYPAQRSRGTRWFISFYLQLKASEKEKFKRVFFLDEPGANLHSKAQGDVLKLINKLPKETSMVVYSTHSPQLLEYAKLFRVHAVQRNSDQDDSPTTIIDAHHLGTASSDTLSPVLSAMGVDFSHNRVIKKENNVLLEEMSGFYYISAFWKLTGQTKEVHLIAATGVNKIEALANMFRGWDLGFIIAVDDDKAGREAYKSIKKELYGDDDALTNKNMLKFPNCPSIEDAFTAADFKKCVLRDETIDIPNTNGEYLKLNNRSKPVLAFQFFLQVEDGKLQFEQLDDVTRANILAIVEGIASRLAPQED
ncbi:MAG: hypothetical protein JWO98_5452 [Frankiales bacterium]|nr:hypothetical protein [Frankiales bacterium]